MAVKNTALVFNRPRIFTPTFVRTTLENRATAELTFEDAAERNTDSTASFRFDSPGSGIKSTQQVNVDFAQFENHTFFNSAQVNVNVAFDRIINEFPFDGSRREVEAFLDSLTGFENFVLDKFPKNKGYLFFSGAASTGPDHGTYIKVNDFAGSLFPTLSRLTTGDNVMDPGLKPISFEMHLFIPSQTNDHQVVCQKISGSTQGLTLHLNQSSSTDVAELQFTAVSASSALSASFNVEKGQFNHIVAAFNRKPGLNRLELYINEKLVATSSNDVEFGEIGFETSPLVIGSGTNVVMPLTTVAPAETLSGAIDDFRVFHSVRNVRQQELYGKKGIFASDDLKLYFKFNEPTGSLGTNDTLVLDSSGNSLHATIANYTASLRTTSSVAVPMTYEKSELSPVLWPAYHSVIDLNVDLLASASDYDDNNPNLITRLVPEHMFLEGQAFEAYEMVEGTIVDEITGSSIPGSVDIGSTQLLSSLLYIWAKSFDEMKTVTDSFSNLLHVDYDTDDISPDQFLSFLARYYGFEIPALFSTSTIEQFIDAENLDHTVSTNELSLQSVQNAILRRVLINIRDIIRSKGTLHSIKSFIRSIGIDPDANFRIREFGGPTSRTLKDVRENRTEVSTLLNMSGAQAIIQSAYLSSSRVETGWPEAQGSFINKAIGNEDHGFGIHGISTNQDDGLLTSGSFTYEAIYRYPITGVLPAVTESLVRLETLGSSTDGGPFTLANVTAVSSSTDPAVKLFARVSSTDTREPFKLTLTGANVFDGDQWSVSFGRYRNDDPTLRSVASSSYFLRCAKQSFGRVIEEHITQSLFLEEYTNDPNNNTLQNISATDNSDGAFLTIGSESITRTASTTAYLNGTTNVTEEARNTQFTGKVGHIRFWSKGLTYDEWNEHVLNFKSLGVENPLVNFSFNTQRTGSFERLRLDVSTDQLNVSSSTGGTVELFDFSQNDLIFTGSNFEDSEVVIQPETFYFSFLSSKFDEAVTSEKVRSRGFLSFDNASRFDYASVGPIYEIDPSERPSDDTRFSIDFSIVKALDEDIVKMFSTLDALDNVIGDPELMFSPDYPGLENLRDIYFNRLTDRINIKGFFEFFKWFDTTIGEVIAQLVPRKTRYFGVNFVVEPHVLERAKMQYRHYDIYIGESDRGQINAIDEFETIVGRH